MSHLIEEYAKSLGVKIGKPTISEHFYPISSDKYITFSSNNKKIDCKTYDHWKIVLNLINPYLKKEGIDTIQVGTKDDMPIPDLDISVTGSTFKQMSYIINKSMLHIGTDGLLVHVASSFDVPFVSLYSNSYPECSSPIWNTDSSSVDLAPDFSKIKPSFKSQENPKRINEINPEKVASAILNLLEIENDLDSYETINIGKYHKNKISEAIPNFIPDSSFHPETVVNLRCDYEMVPQFLHHWMKFKVNLMFDDPIDPNIIYENRENIAGMTIFMDKQSVNEDYLNFLNQLNLKYSLICKDLNIISDIRMKFFDYTVEEYTTSRKKDLDFVSQLCDNTYYHSNKTLISNNKQYSSKAAWISGIEKTSSRQKIIDIDEFWEEVEHLNIYNYVETKEN